MTPERLKEIRERNDFIRGGSYGDLETHKKYLDELDKQKFDIAELLELLSEQEVEIKRLEEKLAASGMERGSQAYLLEREQLSQKEILRLTSSD